MLLTTDSLLVNHLIMADSSMVILGAKTTVIKTVKLEVGINCSIIGDGMDAILMNSLSNSNPSVNAENGEDGKSLILVSTIFDAKSALSVFLNGGNGGDGSLSFLPGDGGEGGDLFFIIGYSEKNNIEQQIELKNEGGYSGKPPNSGLHSDASTLPKRKKGDFKIIATR
jgi:hypothetical protein